MRLVGPLYRRGVDSRIDEARWFSLPPVPVLIDHQLDHPIGRAALEWDGELLVCALPFERPTTGRDFENWGRLASLPYLDFSYRLVSGPDGQGVVFAEVSLVREPTIFDLPGWTMED